MSASASHQSASTIEAASAVVPAASADIPRPQGGLGIFRLVTTVITLILGGGVFSLAGDQAANGASGAVGLTIMSLLYAPGILMYIKGKKERGEPYLRSTLDKVVVFIILAAAVASIVLVVTGQVVL